MKDKIANLIDLKSIITIIITIAMVIFTWKGIVSSDMFISVGTAVFTYYFTRKNGEEKPEIDLRQQEIDLRGDEGNGD